MNILVVIKSEDHWWFENYFHFMVDAMLELYLILKNTEALGSKNIGVQYEGKFGGIVKYFCPAYRLNQSVDPLTFPLVLTVGGSFENRRKPTESAFHHLSEMAAYILNQIPPAAPPIPAGTIIFASRLEHRTIVGLPEVVSSLQAAGYPAVLVDFGALTFEQQVDFARSSSMLVGAHGAALTNMLYLPSGATVVELFPPGFVIEIYGDMARALGHSYQPLTARDHDATVARLKPLPHFDTTMPTPPILAELRDAVSFEIDVAGVTQKIIEFHQNGKIPAEGLFDIPEFFTPPVSETQAMTIHTESFEIQRSAVILHGLVHRSLRHVVASLRKNVLAPLARMGEVDVFFHSWDVPEITNPRTGETGRVLDPSEVAKWLPEANGIFESQEEFDRTVDWERMFDKNPMRHCTDSEEGARATLMNFRRALESQERAWRFFEETKTQSYARVVMTRGDLRFLEELGTSNIERSTSNVEAGRIWVPKFHSWGGVNDRFAMGGEKEMGIYCRRAVFADECLSGGELGNSEQNLMEWLEKNWIQVELMDFVFQRIRADGKVADLDGDLVAGEEVTSNIELADESMRDWLQEGVNERFLILAREAGPAAESLMRVLEPLGSVEVMVDRPVAADFGGRACSEEEGWENCRFNRDSSASTVADRRYIHIPDGEVAGFEGLMGRAADLPPITAWSRALLHLSRTLKDHEMVWLVEDDVAGDADSFARLVERTRSRNTDLSAMNIRTPGEDPGWYFWHVADGRFDDPCRAFQPLCRVSARLIREILRFREEHGRFVFHELLFASLARRGGMSMLDWNKDEEFGGFFPAFRYRPEVNAVNRGIFHPVKDARVHEAICSIPPAGFPRLGKATLEGWSILWDDYLFLVKLCRKYSIKHVAEFGPGDSTLAFLDAGCRVVSYEHDDGWRSRSAERFAGEDAVEVVHCPEGTVPGHVPFEPEIVFVDGPPFREGQEMSRLQPCEWALEKCGCFLLHDMKRAGEQATLAEMERRGMSVTRIPTRKGLALVVDPQRRPEMIPATREFMTSRYQGHAFKGWFVEDFVAWSVMFGDPWAPVKILETGAADGVSANLMLDEIFTHPLSEVHGIELYEGDDSEQSQADFETNAGTGGHAGQIHLYEGTTREVLAWMIAGDGFWESFDFIHLNGAGDAAEMLADACQAWSLLKPGGILVLDGGENEKPGVDAFLSVYSDRVMPLFGGRRVAVMKR